MIEDEDKDEDECIGLGPEVLRRLGLEVVDEGIRPIVGALNSRGYTTWASCAGGEGHDHSVAWISFDEAISRGLNPKDLSEIRKIVKEYTDIPFRVRKQEGLVDIKFLGAFGGSVGGIEE